MFKKTLIISSFYEPAFKAGGPIKSLKNMLSLEIFNDPLILTNDYDYDGTHLDHEQKKILKRSININYLSKIEHFKSFLSFIFLNKETEIIYLNGFFNPIYQLYLMGAFLFKDIKIIISPRGCLGKNELAIKPAKKMLIIKIIKILFLLRPNKEIIFHVTSEREISDIQQIFNTKNVSCELIQNLIDSNNFFEPKNNLGKLNVIFLSRISKKKNMHISKDIFSEVQNLNLILFGPYSKNEENYFKKIDKSLKDIGKLNYAYMGSLKPQSIRQELNKNDVFFLPTLGENFGHAVVEAMLAGLIIVISDKTPWNHLENRRFLWCIKDNDVDEYINVFKKLSAMSSEEIYNLKKDSYHFFHNYFRKNNNNSEKAYRNLFKV